MNGFDEEKFLEHLEIENAQLKKELERYHSIFNVKGKGLTSEQEKFWSNPERLQCSGIEAEILFVACCEWRMSTYPMLVIMRDKTSFGSNFYTVDGRYDLNRETNMDIVQKEVPNG